MARHGLSPRAREDLKAIWRYSRNRWGLDQADSYVRAIDVALDALAQGRRSGLACNDIRPSYLKLSVRSHVIFYRISGDDIDVSRILDQRMDFARHL
ncbi:MAG: plasmid stabilization protein ParE [Caulobacter sp.]|nr:plasmid stabilization protein ParE [Caulobacter sp.]